MKNSLLEVFSVGVSTGSSSETVRIFQNPIFERFTHVHPVTPFLVWAPIITYFYWRAISLSELSYLSIAQVTILALVFWSLCEYGIHRFLFHWRSENKAIRNLTWMFHGIHHELPNDKTRLLMPPAGSLFLGSLFYVLFRKVLGPVWCDPFFAGFLFGYLIYDYTHFITHFHNPRTQFGKVLKKNHMVHHFVSDQLQYGVSSPIWDFIFGTAEKRQS